jgi:hypothetical protein
MVRIATKEATGRPQDGPYYNGFCVQSDRSATDAWSAGDRELTRLDTRFSPAFTEDGIENFRQIIADERAAGRAPPQLKPAK